MKHVLTVCMAALTLGWPVASSAANVISSTAQLTDLRYRLVDLDPNDGIDPAVTFSAGRTRLGMQLGEFPITEALTSSGPFDVGANDQLSGEGMQARQIGNGFAVSSSFAAPGPSELDREVGVSAGEVSWPEGLAWTLSPHTSLILEGHASASSAVDLTSLVGTPCFFSNRWAWPAP